jgi:hypothetical protein
MFQSLENKINEIRKDNINFSELMKGLDIEIYAKVNNYVGHWSNSISDVSHLLNDETLQLIERVRLSCVLELETLEKEFNLKIDNPEMQKIIESVLIGDKIEDDIDLSKFL